MRRAVVMAFVAVVLVAGTSVAEAAPQSPALQYRVGNSAWKALKGAAVNADFEVRLSSGAKSTFALDGKAAGTAAASRLRIRPAKLQAGRHLLQAKAGDQTASAAFSVAKTVKKATATVNRPLRIMPLGASMTEGTDEAPGGYRTKLEKDLLGAGYSFDFVGSLSGGPPDLKRQKHEGHGGWCLTAPCYDAGSSEWADGKVAGWVKAAQPDLILLQMGNNDLNSGKSGEETAQALTKILNQIYAAKPDVTVVVAQLVWDLGITDGSLHTYNTLIPGIAKQMKAKGRSISVVNMENVVDRKAEYADETHPNQAGYDKVGDANFKAIRALPVAARTPKGA